MNKFKPIVFTSVWTEAKDYLFITFGLLLYAFGWAGFLIPNKITTGGVTGISAIVYYGTGIPIQNTYVLINIVLLVFALKILGWKFCLKTIYGIGVLYFLLWFLQRIIVDEQGNALSLVGDEPFMAVIVGAALCGMGLGIAFTHNGSTGGTDIIAAIVNKYRDITFGRMTMLCDLCIISSSSFIPGYTIEKVIFGYSTLIVIGLCIDYVVNNARQSVQFLIFSKEYEKISDAVTHQLHRGVTLLDGVGWYSKRDVKVIVILAKKRESTNIFRLVKAIDPNAFVSQSAVIGVFGEGFDKIKVK
ncbi:MAG TPA: hypothetical protein DCZ73_01870 [Bacteroides sp.]|nr:YitT family protein [Phocaeicola coprophilus]HBB06484.1 hypothetical protein [Bacteroides sp.]